jgi:hypothetical protein
MVNVCGDNIDTGIIATVAGVYKLVVSYLGTEFTINSPDTPIDDEIVFPAQDLNEDYKFTGKIIDPNGQLVTTTIETIVYDCVSFKTGMGFVVNPITP